MIKLFSFFLAVLIPGASSAAEMSYSNTLKPFINSYCIKCHGPSKQKSNLRLDNLPFTLKDLANVEHWQSVLDELNQGNMPPENAKHPEVEEFSSVLDFLMDSLEKSKKNLYGKGKGTLMRRLNKRDYSNSVFDLTGVKIPEDSLPQDPKGASFDTDGSNLFMSSYHFFQYQSLAKKAIRDAIHFENKPEVRRIVFHPVAGLDLVPLKFKNGVASKTLQNYQSNLKAFLKKFKIPLKDALSMKDQNVKKKSGANTNAKTVKVPEGLMHNVIISPWAFFTKNNQKGNGMIERLLMSLNGMVDKGSQLSTGMYKFSITCGYGNMDPSDKAFIAIGTGNARKKSFSTVEKYDFVELKAKSKKPQEIVLEYYIDMNNDIGLKTDSIFHIKSLFQNPIEMTPDMKKNNGMNNFPFISISRIEVSGPHYKEWPPASHKKIFPTRQGNLSETTYIRKIITSFAKKAFRSSPPTDKYLKSLMAIYQERRDEGESMEKAIEEPLSIILASPSFIYIAEENTDNKLGYISQEELAIRLAYFLWSSPPDERLLKLAHSNKLKDPKVLRSEVRRLILDKRSFKFSTGFVEQWLDVNEIAQRDVPVPRKFSPVFKKAVKASMAKEPIHFFDTIMRTNYSLSNFIDSEFVVVDNVLANYYGLSAPGKVGFSKVKLPRNSPRGGLVGQGAFHLIGSDGVHTKPILRGAFVLSKIIGKPTPPPPENIDMIDADLVGRETAKELIALHTSKAQCASCHRKIDPLGWGLENFSAISKWRTVEPLKKLSVRDIRAKGSLAVETSGHMPNGNKYKGLEEFKKQLMGYKHQFSEALIEDLVSYALGKRIGVADEKLVKILVSRAKANDYKLASIISDIACSKTFRIK
ncbi:DUF1592 domain-containing protein [Lentisphaera marina]|uniref:DUF1592 domain-containing protein n=1 Tax=Lentisphaera marina TaxID=1111041 RepID=UPI002367128C|nr:DUF1592 domain-containing protein [Lentisphaera marina]MDD7987253.1 DUF1592 domain-containing protein [Lentisphaera marina]